MSNHVPPPPADHRFKPGQSGNPKGTRNLRAVRKAISSGKPSAIYSLLNAVAQGAPWAVTLWFHYFYGKPVDQVQLMDSDGAPLSVSVVINRTVPNTQIVDVTPAEVRTLEAGDAPLNS